MCPLSHLARLPAPHSPNPVRKVFYNLTITGLSIAVAFFVGTIELVGVLYDKFCTTSSA